MTPREPIRVVLVDDEKPARDRIRRLLRNHPDFVIAGEAADVESARALIEEQRPDLCFLDVRMPGGDGFQVLRGLRHLPAVIFTTAYDRYAVEAFEVDSLDYLLKPFDPERFAAALERARARLVQLGDDAAPATARWPDKLPARRGTKVLLLDPDAVYWFEAEQTLVFACTAEGRFLVDRTLTDLERHLGDAFFRVHRRYLVRVALIAEILPNESGTWRIVMRDPGRTVVPLSRRQARRLRERIPW